MGERARYTVIHSTSFTSVKVSVFHGRIPLFALLGEFRPWDKSLPEAKRSQPYLRRIIEGFISGDVVIELERNHAFHCINVLREELLCTASDTLLSISTKAGEGVPAAGFNQTRQCVDWAPLRDWAVSVCFLKILHMTHPLMLA